MSAATGCGGAACTCGGGSAKPAQVTAAINGIALHEAGQRPDEETLRERAWGELLRQEAVRQGVLPRHLDLEAPELSLGDHRALEDMLERAVPVPQPNEDECRRYYDARRSHFVEGRAGHLRHILFAVTPGVDVRRLSARAEQALLELTRPGAGPGRFAELARELSNCPSGAQGGDLGWLRPDECADELARELFHRPESSQGTGLRPRLVHSRYGFHIVDVLARQEGRPLAFEEAQGCIATQLAQQSRAQALHQYMQLLAGAAVIEGLELDGADSPLVQ